MNQRADNTKLDTVEAALEAIGRGEMIVVVDDASRENEGDLILAGSKATPEAIAFMIRHTSGILCTPMPRTEAQRLRLDPMVAVNDAPLGTAFTVSIDYRVGLTTGISAEERCNTARALANPNVGPADFVRPGHIFPLVARDGGVLVRSGHTEAAVDLVRMAGLPPVGVLAELMNDDGTVMRMAGLVDFARKHGLRMIAVADIIAYRMRSERLVDRVGTFPIATQGGPARAVLYATPFDDVQHMALVFGDVGGGREGSGGREVAVRIHREDVLGDVFGQRTGPDATVLARAIERLGRQGQGVLVYLREGSAGVPAAAAAKGESEAQQWREIGIGAQILRDLGVSSIRLLATHRRHYVGLSGFGIAIAETEFLEGDEGPAA